MPRSHTIGAMPRPKALLVFGTLLAAPVAASAASSLPIREGIYATSCQNQDIRINNIGYFENVLSPSADGQEGFCHFGKLKVKGNVYSGKSECDEGSRIPSPTGTYKFSYKILSETSFVTNGKTFVWCLPHL